MATTPPLQHVATTPPHLHWPADCVSACTCCGLMHMLWPDAAPVRMYPSGGGHRRWRRLYLEPAPLEAVLGATATTASTCGPMSHAQTTRTAPRHVTRTAPRRALEPIHCTPPRLGRMPWTPCTPWAPCTAPCRVSMRRFILQARRRPLPLLEGVDGAARCCTAHRCVI
jgi:hypothetical protein